MNHAQARVVILRLLRNTGATVPKSAIFIVDNRSFPRSICISVTRSRKTLIEEKLLQAGATAMTRLPSNWEKK